MRPIWVEFPTDKLVFSEEDQFLLGGDLLIKPITQAGQTNTQVYLPGNQPWYSLDLTVPKKYLGPGVVSISSPLEAGIPVLQRGGSIIPKKERQRRSTSQMLNDPLTLVVALDTNQQAKGELYLDDGHTFDYKNGKFLRRKFSFSDNKLTSVAIGTETFSTTQTVERVVVFGFHKRPSKVEIQTGSTKRELVFVYEGEKLIAKKPDVLITQDWNIVITV